jgi:hypothetical protein
VRPERVAAAAPREPAWAAFRPGGTDPKNMSSKKSVAGAAPFGVMTILKRAEAAEGGGCTEPVLRATKPVPPPMVCVESAVAICEPLPS